ncbi:hypothetical protein RhiirC2_800390 [Rhizophagus irregularis]|uniref:Uncharacterized protein n=1 Tax=Rhizophagus irregularis TaxID=588596 RepID=A0A2N1M3R9_9GLOM|nr:hypothetical protein RhiirC2_800390 [Rhizophagus irregularis]
MSTISIAMNIELLIKVVKYPESRNIRHKLSFADKTIQHTTKLESLIRKICNSKEYAYIPFEIMFSFWSIGGLLETFTKDFLFFNNFLALQMIILFYMRIF